ncbi:hypothetical protein [Actinomyces minihominis]|uniref:hypothetical protein n=1 Tax=Actinomyces minihominis TaxID=2002838 RepID=UPI000C077673|nr:hypothetical protein [Actinomyces minihominis]
MLMGLWLTVWGAGYLLSLVRSRGLFAVLTIASSVLLGSLLQYCLVEAPLGIVLASSFALVISAASWRFLIAHGWRWEISLWVVMLGGAAILVAIGSVAAAPAWLKLAACTGVLALIGSPANRLCRTVLDTHYPRDTEGDVRETETSGEKLRGGRIIGPLERVLLVT